MHPRYCADSMSAMRSLLGVLVTVRCMYMSMVVTAALRLYLCMSFGISFCLSFEINFWLVSAQFLISLRTVYDHFGISFASVFASVSDQFLPSTCDQFGVTFAAICDQFSYQSMISLWSGHAQFLMVYSWFHGQPHVNECHWQFQPWFMLRICFTVVLKIEQLRNMSYGCIQWVSSNSSGLFFFSFLLCFAGWKFSISFGHMQWFDNSGQCCDCHAKLKFQCNILLLWPNAVQSRTIARFSRGRSVTGTWNFEML